MIKKLSLSGFGLVATFILISAINKPTSSGAPSASTGGGGEQTCAMSTCHDDNSINSGTAQLSVEIADMVKVGEDATIKVKIKDAGKTRFGFQVTALDESNTKVGEFIISDNERTQILGGNNSFPNRQYLTYTYLGTIDTDGEAEWEAKWKSTIKGKVTFYVAGISANNDGQDKGDFTYTTSKSITVAEASKITKITNSKEVTFNLSNSLLIITNPYFNYIKTITITDIQGKILFTKTINNADASTKIKLPELSTGVVIATIQTSTGILTKKLFATHD